MRRRLVVGLVGLATVAVGVLLVALAGWVLIWDRETAVIAGQDPIILEPDLGTPMLGKLEGDSLGLFVERCTHFHDCETVRVDLASGRVTRMRGQVSGKGWKRLRSIDETDVPYDERVDGVRLRKPGRAFFTIWRFTGRLVDSRTGRVTVVCRTVPAIHVSFWVFNVEADEIPTASTLLFVDDVVGAVVCLDRVVGRKWNLSFKRYESAGRAAGLGQDIRQR